MLYFLRLGNTVKMFIPKFLLHCVLYSCVPVTDKPTIRNWVIFIFKVQINKKFVCYEITMAKDNFCLKKKHELYLEAKRQKYAHTLYS